MMISKVDAIVLFVENRATCTAFYRETLGLQETFGDDSSIGFQLGGTDFILLDIPAAVKMISEEALALGKGISHRVLLCAGVEDVDATYKALTAKGVAFIKPPVSQAWGRRTAYFADPAGNLWEIWHALAAEQ